jgi:hypothetical protein
MIAMLKQIIIVYWEVLCFKRSPLTTPTSKTMLGIALCLTLFVGGLQFHLAKMINTTQVSVLTVLASLFIQIALFAFYSQIILRTQKSEKYFMQLFICWLMMLFFLDFMSSAIMGIFVGLGSLGFASSIHSVLLYFSLVLGIVFSLWQVSFIVHLFRVFLKQTVWMALLFYLGWMLINYLYLVILKSF